MSPLELGGARRLNVRRERAVIGGAARLLYASDLHLGLPWTRRVPGQLAEIVRCERPDAVLLGGDLVERRAGLDALDRLLRELGSIAPVGAVPGNHDVRAGVHLVRDTCIAAGVRWLHEEPLDVAGVRVVGRAAPAAPAVPAASTDGGTERGVVLCGHDPEIWPRARDAGIPLTVAGHLHGCQVRLGATGPRELPGAWFYRWNGPRFDEGAHTLLVSRGAADTLPLRWDCPHEVLLVTCE